MRTEVLTTATDYGVSTTSGCGITGVLLNVYKNVPCQPTKEHPFTEKTEYAVKAMPFPNHDAADAYCLANGWLKVYKPKS